MIWKYVIMNELMLIYVNICFKMFMYELGLLMWYVYFLLFFDFCYIIYCLICFFDKGERKWRIKLLFMIICVYFFINLKIFVDVFLNFLF